MKIRSSGWETDALVAVPESLLLSYAWFNFAERNPSLRPWLFEGGLLLSLAIGILLCLGAFRAWKKEALQEETSREEEKMRMLEVGENIVREAVKDHLEEQLKWEDMIRENMGGDPLKPRSLNTILLRTFAFSLIGFLSLTVWYAPGIALPTEWVHVMAALLLVVTGAWKYHITGRNAWSGAVRMLLNGAFLFLLVRALYWVVR